MCCPRYVSACREFPTLLLSPCRPITPRHSAGHVWAVPYHAATWTRTQGYTCPYWLHTEASTVSTGSTGPITSLGTPTTPLCTWPRRSTWECTLCSWWTGNAGAMGFFVLHRCRAVAGIGKSLFAGFTDSFDSGPIEPRRSQGVGIQSTPRACKVRSSIVLCSTVSPPCAKAAGVAVPADPYSGISFLFFSSQDLPPLAPRRNRRHDGAKRSGQRAAARSPTGHRSLLRRRRRSPHVGQCSSFRGRGCCDGFGSQASTRARAAPRWRGGEQNRTGSDERTWAVAFTSWQ